MKHNTINLNTFNSLFHNIAEMRRVQCKLQVLEILRISSHDWKHRKERRTSEYFVHSVDISVCSTYSESSRHQVGCEIKLLIFPLCCLHTSNILCSPCRYQLATQYPWNFTYPVMSSWAVAVRAIIMAVGCWICISRSSTLPSCNITGNGHIERWHSKNRTGWSWSVYTPVLFLTCWVVTTRSLRFCPQRSESGKPRTERRARSTFVSLRSAFVRHQRVTMPPQTQTKSRQNMFPIPTSWNMIAGQIRSLKQGLNMIWLINANQQQYVCYDMNTPYTPICNVKFSRWFNLN